ncbi:MAG: hypothetical protein WBB19_08670 [Desulforhopalus sp.]
MTTFLRFEVKYSQPQEVAAGRCELESLTRYYGDVGGRTNFYKRLARKTADEYNTCWLHTPIHKPEEKN